MIDPNLGFDPHARGVKTFYEVYGKPYSDRFAYVIDPYVYGDYVGPVRDLVMSQYKRVEKMVDNIMAKFHINPTYMTIVPFKMDKFDWNLDFETYLYGMYECRSTPITFIVKYRPMLLILTDNELYNRVAEAVGTVIQCIISAENEERWKEERRRVRTGRPLDRGPRRDRPGGRKLCNAPTLNLCFT